MYARRSYYGAEIANVMTAAAHVEPAVRYYVPGVYIIGVRAPAEARQGAAVDREEGVRYAHVITSYSIHYTKLYDHRPRRR